MPVARGHTLVSVKRSQEDSKESNHASQPHVSLPGKRPGVQQKQSPDGGIDTVKRGP